MNLLSLPLLLSLILLSGCMSSTSGDVYRRDQAGREQIVRLATVESVRQVLMEGTKSPVGSVAGAAIGGIAGSALGGGRGSSIFAIIGAVAGGLAGAAIEEGVTRRIALEITARLDNGTIIAVVQEAAPGEFQPGDRVRIISSYGQSRVTR